MHPHQNAKVYQVFYLFLVSTTRKTLEKESNSPNGYGLATSSVLFLLES